MPTAHPAQQQISWVIQRCLRVKPCLSLRVPGLRIRHSFNHITAASHKKQVCSQCRKVRVGSLGLSTDPVLTHCKLAGSGSFQTTAIVRIGVILACGVVFGLPLWMNMAKVRSQVSETLLPSNPAFCYANTCQLACKPTKANSSHWPASKHTFHIAGQACRACINTFAGLPRCTSKWWRKSRSKDCVSC